MTILYAGIIYLCSHAATTTTSPTLIETRGVRLRANMTVKVWQCDPVQRGNKVPSVPIIRASL